ncbi:MAG: PilZ domain-containing protein [Nitrospirales bacterium]
MHKVIAYRGYTIESAPLRLEGEKWRLRISITLADTRGVLVRQFDVESLYSTEQEADIHGIFYGQRIIDGKVPGHSVVGMKTTDRRTTPRLRVQFAITFASSSSVEGTGIMRNLSTEGCRIESPMWIEAGESLELRIYTLDIEWPPMIESASVQWASGQTFGLAFSRIKEPERLRLHHMLDGLWERA